MIELIWSVSSFFYLAIGLGLGMHCCDEKKPGYFLAVFICTLCWPMLIAARTFAAIFEHFDK